MAIQREDIIPGIGTVRMNLDTTPDIISRSILAIVTLTKRDRTGVDGQYIIFSLGDETRAIESTNDGGEASYKFENLAIGTHAVYAKVVSVDTFKVKQTHTFSAVVSQTRAPTGFKVNTKPEKETSRYEVVIEVWDEKGGVKWPIVILDSDNPEITERMHEKETSDSGIYIYHVNTDRPRNIFVTVVGTDKETDKIRLPGPRRKKRQSPPPEPEPQVADVQGSVGEIAENAHYVYKYFLNQKIQGKEDQDIINSRHGDPDLPFLKKLWFKFIVKLHYDNYRWKILFYFVCSLGVLSFILTPFIFTAPSDNASSYLQIEDEEFYKDIIDYKEILGGKSVVKTFALKFLYKAALISYSAFTFFGFVLFVYTFIAFGDDLMRALETARVKMWDKYGEEIATKSGIFSKSLIGQQQPQQAIYSAGTGQPIQGGFAQQMPAQGYAPITRRYYLFWEVLISTFSEFFAKIFIR